jgi:hypothetical protein
LSRFSGIRLLNAFMCHRNACACVLGQLQFQMLADSLFLMMVEPQK